MRTRAQMWDRLQGHFDVLVIGGGINGAGIARDAALRGLRVALVEMGDLAMGTSSRSSKLVHGGLRYLEQLELGLVFESVNERQVLMRMAPHLVHPLPFVFPIYEGDRVPLWKMRLGVFVYHLLCWRRAPGRWETLSTEEVARREPALERSRMTGAPLYFDASTDDARLTLETAIDAAHSGAVVATYVRATSFIHDNGRVAGACVRDVLGGAEREVRATVVINATGPWTDRTLAMGADHRPMLRPTKGTHIVVPHDKLPVNHAIVCIHPVDGRVLFAIPWGPQTYVGTTDTDYTGDPAEVYATADDVTYLIDAAHRYFAAHRIERDDILSTWAGLRPLLGGGTEGKSASAVSREHTIETNPAGVVTVAGGKLTTYRKMSGEVVDHAMAELRRSGRVPTALRHGPAASDALPGAVGWPSGGAAELERQVSELAPALAADTVTLLVATYGTRALGVAERAVREPDLAERLCEGRPEIRAQVDFSIDEELAATVLDVLKQRTQLYYRDVDQGLGAVEWVGNRMATRLGWSGDQTRAMKDGYRDEVARSRAWRTQQAG